MTDPGLQQVRDTPSFKVLLEGRELAVEAAGDILDVRVSQHVEGASMFTIGFNNWHADKQEFKYVDGTLLSEGVDLDVKVGFGDNLKTLIAGEITALEPEYPEKEAPTLQVHGYDRLHRFRRGCKTRTFTNMKDSQIADKIASELQLRTQVDDTQITYDYILQDNLSDIDFLVQRARYINYEVLVKDKTLYFRKVANNKSSVAALAYGLTLKSFYPRLSTMNQVSEVVVQGWNPKTKEAISGKASQGDVISTMGGQNLGLAISDKAFFKTKTFLVDRPILSEGEANQAAKAKLNEIALQFVTGEGVAIGNPDIQAGDVMELSGLGQRFSGLYYITSATHIVNQSGYTTRFTVARTAT